MSQTSGQFLGKRCLTLARLAMAVRLYTRNSLTPCQGQEDI